MINQSRPIGIFDSGVGGLTVVNELKHRLPNEQLLYFGDTARLPYGNKSHQTILRYSMEIATFLLTKNIKLLVVACNTASALALQELQQQLTIPVIGVIEPGAVAAVKRSKHHQFAILGTKGTIESNAYQSLILQMVPDATLFPIACPLFVPLVEEGWINHFVTREVIKEYLDSLQEVPIDTLLLGCTHYPLLKPLIQEVMGDRVLLIDSGICCAEEVERVLRRDCLLSLCRGGEDRYFVSDDPKKFQGLAKTLFNLVIDRPIQVE
jgi:glutamate racemase